MTRDLLMLLPWWRNRLCRLGRQQCGECAAYARWSARIAETGERLVARP